MAEKDLFQQSEYIEIVTGMMNQEFAKPVIITEFHILKMGDGNTVFYVITQEGYRFMVNLMGRKAQDDAILYWVENIDHAGKVCEFYYDEDRFVITFQRGNKYNHEYLAFLYVYGNKYPAVRFIPGTIYRNYSNMLTKVYKKHILNLPKDLII